MCENGYSLLNGTSNEIVRCLPSGKWTNGPQCSRRFCGSPPVVPNASIVASTLKTITALTDDQVTYQCDDGFTFPVDSPSVAICKNNGAWSRLPECVKMPKNGFKKASNIKKVSLEKLVAHQRCGLPPTIDNGVITQSTENSVFYGCNDGFQVIGSDRIECTSHNVWSDPPLCLKTYTPNCETLPHVAHAFISERQNGNSSTFEGNRVKFSCFVGFAIEGDPWVTCSTNSWGVLPKCVEDLSLVTCGEAPDIKNGVIVSKDFLSAASSMGSKAVYRCKSGYVLSNGGSKSFAVCRPTGTWTAPICIEAAHVADNVYCPSIPKVHNAVVTFISNETSLNMHRPGTNVVYECNQGYTFKSSSFSPLNYAECANDGNWTPLSECVQQNVCQHLPVVINGRVRHRTFTSSSALLGDKVGFDCLPGFEMVGNGEFAYCDLYGKWIDVPKCVRKCKFI